MYFNKNITILSIYGLTQFLLRHINNYIVSHILVNILLVIISHLSYEGINN
jgi:hypothetical protein